MIKFAIVKFTHDVTPLCFYNTLEDLLLILFYSFELYSISYSPVASGICAKLNCVN